MERECLKHGVVEHVKEVTGYMRCKKCRYEHIKNRRHRIKQQALAYKGGKCEVCDYDKCVQALEFHHLNPSTKDFNISSKWNSKSWDIVKAELDKCILVCANCHREIHAELGLV